MLICPRCGNHWPKDGTSCVYCHYEPPPQGRKQCPFCPKLKRWNHLDSHIRKKHPREYSAWRGRQWKKLREHMQETQKKMRSAHGMGVGAIDDSEVKPRSTRPTEFQMEQRVRRCSCGNPVIPGTNYCYSCSAD